MGKYQATIAVTFEFDGDELNAEEFAGEIAETLRYQGVGFLTDNGYTVENVSASMQGVRVRRNEP